MSKCPKFDHSSCNFGCWLQVQCSWKLRLSTSDLSCGFCLVVESVADFSEIPVDLGFRVRPRPETADSLWFRVPKPYLNPE